MPKGKGNDYRPGTCTSSPSPMIPTGAIKQQCCVVCYTQFYPFHFDNEKFSGNMTKNFYVSLNIKSLMGMDEAGDGDEEEEVLSLPFCPSCNVKVALMATYHIELQNLKSKYNNIRNDLAFTVVESIGKNSREGPIDSIRQQIHDSWKSTYEKESKGTDEVRRALDQIASDPSSEPHNCGDFICCNLKGDKPDTKLMNGLMLPGKFQDLTDNPGKYSDPKMPTLTPFKQQQTLGRSFSNIKAIPSTSKGFQINSPVPSLSKTPLFRKQVQATVPSHIVSRIRRTGSFRNGNVSGGRNGRWRISPEKRKFDTGGVANETFCISSGEGESSGSGPGGKDGEKNISPKRRRFGNRSVSPDMTEITSSPTRGTPTKAELKSGPPTLTKTPDGKMVYKCKYCTKDYDKISRLRRHESFVHPNSKKLQCTICKQGFSSSVAYKRHMQHQHNQISSGIGETMHCPYCIKVFVKSSAFEAHLKTHELIRTSVKGRRSSRSSGLFGIMADVVKIEGDSASGSEKPEESKVQQDGEANLPEAEDNSQGTETEPEPGNATEQETLSQKPKKKPNLNRPFGGGRRRRKGKKKVKPVNPDAPPPQKRNRQPKSALPVEPIRKSTRHRGMAESSIPMYPSAEEEETATVQSQNQAEEENTQNNSHIEDNSATSSATPVIEESSGAKQVLKDTLKPDDKIGCENSTATKETNHDQPTEVTKTDDLDLDEGKKGSKEPPVELDPSLGTMSTSTLDPSLSIISPDPSTNSVDIPIPDISLPAENLEDTPKNSTFTVSTDDPVKEDESPSKTSSTTATISELKV